MKKIYSILVSTLLVLSILAAIPHISAYPDDPSDPEIQETLNHLRGVQNDDDPVDGNIGTYSDTLWAVMSIAAAGEDLDTWHSGSDTVVEFLINNASSGVNLTKANEIEKFIIAMAASDNNPGSINGIDYISALKALYINGKMSNDTFLNDDFWGLIALAAIGEDPNSAIIDGLKTYILSNQNPDDGWGYAEGISSDPDSTAFAVVALIAAGIEPIDPVINTALNYIKSWQLPDGGFDNGWGGGLSNADTTSIAILAIWTAGQNPIDSFWTEGGFTPLDFLATCRATDGSYGWQPGIPGFMPIVTTSRTLLARVGGTYPPETIDCYQIEIRIEGTSDTIWAGEVYVNESIIPLIGGGEVHIIVPTALGALDEASQLGGFPYDVEDYGEWGVLVTSIDGDPGTAGWMYRIDYYSPPTGADNFELGVTIPPSPPHDKVLWYAIKDWSDAPTEISIDKTTVDGGESFSVTAYYYDADGTQYLADSTTSVKVVTGGIQYPTDASGQATITIHTAGEYEVYAEGDGYIRSNRITVTVTDSSDEDDNSNLEVNMIPALSLEVTPDAISFGTMGPGDTSNSFTIELVNSGSLNAIVTCTVTDQDSTVFTDCLKVSDDEITWESWASYVEPIEGHDGTRTDYVRVEIPTDYSTSVLGLNEGTITFWLEPDS